MGQQLQRVEQVENLHEQEPDMYKDQDSHMPMAEDEEFGTEPVKFTKFRKIVGGYLDPREQLLQQRRAECKQQLLQQYRQGDHQQQLQRVEQVENLHEQEPDMYKDQDSHVLVAEDEEFGTESVKVEHLHEQEPDMYKDQDSHML